MHDWLLFAQWKLSQQLPSVLLCSESAVYLLCSTMQDLYIEWRLQHLHLSLFSFWNFLPDWMPNIDARNKCKWKSLMPSLHRPLSIMLCYFHELHILLIWILLIQLLVLVKLLSSYSYFFVLLSTSHSYMLSLCLSLQTLLNWDLVRDLQNRLSQLCYWNMQPMQVGNLCFELILSQLSLFLHCLLFFIFLHGLCNIILPIQ